MAGSWVNDMLFIMTTVLYSNAQHVHRTDFAKCVQPREVRSMTIPINTEWKLRSSYNYLIPVREWIDLANFWTRAALCQPGQSCFGRFNHIWRMIAGPDIGNKLANFPSKSTLPYNSVDIVKYTPIVVSLIKRIEPKEEVIFGPGRGQ